MAANTRSRSVSPLVVLAPLVGLTGGSLTALEQGRLPQEYSSVANSAGSWCLVAVLVALVGATALRAACLSVTTLIALLVGYVLVDDVRGLPSSHRMIAMWLTAAVVVGPLLGLAAHRLRRGSPRQAAVATTALSGLLVSEGIYGLTVISSSTSATYWIAEICVGAAVLGLGAWRWLRTWRRDVRSLSISPHVAPATVLAALRR